MSKLKLPGFFTYDFAQPMITVFTNAINEDYRDAIKTEGEYGKRYKALLDDLIDLEYLILLMVVKYIFF